MDSCLPKHGKDLAHEPGAGACRRCDSTEDFLDEEQQVNLDGWMGGWMDGWVGGWVGGWMDGWMDGWVGGWVDGWMDEWVDRQRVRHACVVDGRNRS